MSWPKFSTQPLCRYCGRGIAKHTDSWRIEHTSFDTSRRDSRLRKGAVFCDKPPLTQAQAQRLVNAQIVSVRYSDLWDKLGDDGMVHSSDTETIRHIGHLTTWDGESYEDPYFCNGTCRTRFAYVMAEGGARTPAYAAALKAQQDRKK